MTDIYQNHSTHLTGPAGGAFGITPSDDTVFAQPTRALYVGAAGSVVVEMLLGGTVTFAGVPGGSVLPVRAVRVLAASTASSLVGLY